MKIAGLHAMSKEESVTGADLKAGAVGKIGLEMAVMVYLVDHFICVCWNQIRKINLHYFLNFRYILSFLACCLLPTYPLHTIQDGGLNQFLFWQDFDNFLGVYISVSSVVEF